MVTTSAAPVDMLELPRSATVTAKTRAALARTARAPGKLTVQRFTGASFLAGAAAVFCLPVAACFLIFCLVPASSTAADFCVVCSAFFGSPSASAFASVFVALIVNSFAAASDSSL